VRAFYRRVRDREDRGGVDIEMAADTGRGGLCSTRESLWGICVVTPTDVGPTRLSLYPALPDALGSVCDRQMKVWPDPVIYGLLGAHLGKFTSFHDRNRSGEGVLGRRVEMV
jgi:hypothetical protein